MVLLALVMSPKDVARLSGSVLPLSSRALCLCSGGNEGVIWNFKCALSHAGPVLGTELCLLSQTTTGDNRQGCAVTTFQIHFTPREEIS